MTAEPILGTLAKEFSTDVPSIQAVFEMLDAGLSAPFIGRFRRARTGALSETHVRRLARRREELVELDRRRGTILRAMERVEDLPDGALERVRTCMDRFELEDLYVPYRRPEPEVQLALDRGLGALADRIVAPVPRSERMKSAGEGEATPDGDGADAGAAQSPAAAASTATEPAATEAAATAAATTESATTESATTDPTGAEAAATESATTEPTESEAAATEAAATEAAATESAPTESAPTESAPTESAPTESAPTESAPTEPAPTEPASEGAGEPGAADAATDGAAPAADEAAPETASDASPGTGAAPEGTDAPEADATPGAAPAATSAKIEATPPEARGGAPAAPLDAGPVQPELTPALARLCAPFVDPDKGVHTESEALAGAVRILSDRVGRDAALRGFVRKTMRKKGVLRARALVDEKKAGRHKALLKLKTPIRQLQGHKLTAIRQAQKERAINTFVELDPKEVLTRVRSVLGKHTAPEFDALLEDVARQALAQRLLPVVEEDIRLEIKERSDAEATRFLGSHLRQILLTPFFGRLPVCGVDVSAKGDLALAFLDEHGGLAHDARVEVGEKDEAALGAEFAALLDQHPVEAFAVGSGKAARAAGQRVRAALRAAQRDLPVMVVNDAAATSYANGPRARVELADAAIPTRVAVTLGRRLQDPMGELLKVDPKQLGIGAEQRLVSKANLRRVLDEAVASAVALVGCDFDTAPRSVLEHLPGLGEEAAKRLADKRDAGEIESREQIRAEGILSEAEWVSVAAFLRIRRSPEPLDRTSLHPEQYGLARQLLEAAGGSVEESLGRPGATKGLRRQAFEVDEYTWRDLMRELSFPGRDPRGRNHAPEFISDATDPIRLQPGRVLQGVVTNVASFGAFIDVGQTRDAMVHISQIATRYVRDARELLSVGQAVSARIVESNSKRLALSLKEVSREESEGGGAGGPRRRGGARRGRGRGGRGRGQRDEGPKGPASRIWRRDGAAGAATSSRRGGARRGGGPRRGGGFDRGPRDERVDLKKINAESNQPSNNPFADFFKKGDEPGGGE